VIAKRSLVAYRKDFESPRQFLLSFFFLKLDKVGHENENYENVSITLMVR